MNAYLKRIYYDAQRPTAYGTVKKLFARAKLDGKNYSLKKIRDWLDAQESHTLFKETRSKKVHPKVVVEGKDYQWDIDTFNMKKWSKENEGYSYVLIAIDIFTRFVRTVPLYTLLGKEMKEALKVIFENGTPQYVRSDLGSEFMNSEVAAYLKEMGVEHIKTYNYTKKANYSERAIRTIKFRMIKHLYRKQSHVWIHDLDKATHAYNNSIHRSIKMTPTQALTADKGILWWNQHSHFKKPKKEKKKKDKKISKKRKRKLVTQPKFKFKEGDVVRVVKHRHVFRRQYDEWSTHELYIIIATKTQEGIPKYTLKTWDNQKVEGDFFEDEIVKVRVNKNTEYKVEEVLFKKTLNGVKGFCVRWLGWPERYDSWVSEKDLKDLKT